MTVAVVMTTRRRVAPLEVPLSLPSARRVVTDAGVSALAVVEAGAVEAAVGSAAAVLGTSKPSRENFIDKKTKIYSKKKK
mmetsp:Transcript_30155/g.84240  ORF Transcript_30155/g.84240 Transcript_30155/m.84240 type:complete len:80 (+) Transcript_30155:413-652(+)